MERNFEYMFFGFLAAWMVVIVYVISLGLRERSLRQELDRVKRLVEEREGEVNRKPSKP